MTEKFRCILRYRFFLAAAMVLMLFSNSYAAGGQGEFKHKNITPIERKLMLLF